MSHWQTLVAHAVMGTDRAPVFPLLTDTPLDATLAQLQDLTPSRRLLASAAVAALWERAGMEPSVADKPSPAIAPEDELPFCSPRASHYLLRLLGESVHDLVPEYLTALVQHGKVISPIEMPELFDFAIIHPPLRQLIIPMLGARGRWLAFQNPAWAQLFVTPDVNAISAQWETASRNERLTLLPQLRSLDPAIARDAIAQTWDEDPADDRVAFIEKLQVNLSSDDETCLEAALDDRSKKVRAVAADLLARMPNSALAQRMITRIKPLIKNEKSRLDVALPTQCDATMEHDGIDRKPPQGIGERAWWLAQIIAAVPLSFWTQLTSRTLTELIKLVAKSEQRAVILGGWARAAGRYSDAIWCEVLLLQWIENPWASQKNLHPLVEFSQAENLVERIPQERLETWLIDLLKKKESMEDERDSVTFILWHYHRPWSAALTRAVLNCMWDGSTQALARFSATWAPVPVEQYGDPSVEPEFSAREFSERTTPLASNKLQRVLETLRLRREMLEAIKS